MERGGTNEQAVRGHLPADLGSPGQAEDRHGSLLGALRGHREIEADWASFYVYGVITTLVALGAEDLATKPNPLSALGTVVVGVAAIWLAHTFARLVGDWIRENPFSLTLVLERMRHSWPILSAVIPTAGALALAAAGAYSIDTGISVGEYVAIAELALVGVWAAAVSTRRPAVRVAFPVVLLGVGWLIVGLEQAARHL